MTTLSIRAARREDEASIRRLIVALADYEKLPPPGEAAQQRLINDAFSEQPRFEIFLAEVDEQVVGYAFVFETYSTFLALPTLYLEDLFVLSEYRKHGVGYALMKHLATEARRRGCGRVEWTVLDWNRTAIDFYERLGAKHLGEWLHYRLDSEGIERMTSQT